MPARKGRAAPRRKPTTKAPTREPDSGSLAGDTAEILLTRLLSMLPSDRGGAQERDIFARVSDIAGQTRVDHTGSSEANEADELFRAHTDRVRTSNDYAAGLNSEHLLSLAGIRERANNAGVAVHYANLGGAQHLNPDNEIGREALNAAVGQLGQANVPIIVERLREDVVTVATAVEALCAELRAQR